MAEGGSRKFLAAIIVWLLIIGLGAAVYRYIFRPRKKANVVLKTSAQPLRSDLQTIKLALDSFSGYAVFRSANMQRDLAGQGLQLDLVDDGADYAQRLESIRKGDTPLAVFTIDALIKNSADLGDLPATIVMLIDETRGADAMISYKSAVPNLDALNQPNAQIVLTPNSPSETLARVVLANFNLPQVAKNGWVEANGAADVFKKFKDSKGKTPLAFVLWEPYVSKALEIPDAQVLIDSSRFKGYIVDVLVAEREFLLKNETQVEAVITSYLRAAFARQQEAAGWGGLVLEDSRKQKQEITEAQAAKLAQEIWWKNTMENYAHLGILPPSDAQGLQPMDSMIRNITDVLTKTGAISSDPTGGAPNKLYYDKIFRRLSDQKFHPGLIAGDTAQSTSQQSGSEEKVRKEKELPPLNDDQWNRLLPVGTLQVDPIVFGRGTAKLTDQSRLALQKLAATLKVWPQYYLIVRGHARPEGDLEANRQLAEARSHAAADFLAGEEIPEQRIHAIRIEPSEAGSLSLSVSFLVGQVPY